MGIFEWNDSLSVGIGSIDNQHKQLVELTNNLLKTAENQTQKQEMLQKVISGLKDYTIYHFKHEEKMMMDSGYSGLRIHKQEHDQFITKVNELEERCKANRLIVSIEVSMFIKDWIKNHISNTDRLYTEHFKKKD